MTIRRFNSFSAQQGGFALFVGLIMLLLMSLIGITAMQVTLMQERMAGNFKVQHEGFEQGESALSGPTGRGAIEASPISFGLNCFGGGCVRLITGGAPSTANQLPWIDWLTSEPATVPVPLKSLLYRPQLGATVPNGISLNYYSVAALGQDLASGDAKTALQGVYLFCTNCNN